MQQNILKDSEIVKVYIVYNNANVKKKINVKMRYVDTKTAFFTCETLANFVKPKNKIPAEIVVYTQDGVYSSKTKLNNTSYNLQEIMFEVALPKSWDYKQLRNGSRKKIELPLKLKYNDGFEIEAKTFDLSVGGFSFYSDKTISSIYKSVSCISTIEFPNNLLINFPEKELVKEAKFVREVTGENDFFGQKCFVFRFYNLTDNETMILKNFLMSID